MRGREELGIDLVGPPRPNPSWQGKVEGGHTLDRFEVDWDERRVRCPQGKLSSAWSRQVDHAGTPYVSVWFRQADCGACPARPLCTRAEHQARHLKLPPRAEHEALKAARERLATKEGRRRYARRAGIEGTLSQGVRAFGLRRSRYRGLAKTHLQHVATAAAVNLERLAAWFRAVPRAATRTSRFAALAALEPTSPTVSDGISERWQQPLRCCHGCSFQSGLQRRVKDRFSGLADQPHWGCRTPGKWTGSLV